MDKQSLEVVDSAYTKASLLYLVRYCSGDMQVNFLNMQTNFYYYIVCNFSDIMSIGLPVYWVWLITLVGGIAIYFTNKEQFPARISLLFLSLYLLYFVQRWFVNYRVRKAIDAALK